jgi:hypothetical protein
MFRWFPRTCPEGLVPLDEFPDDGTFRSYLASVKLPYYSLTEHLTTYAAPKGLDILDEEGMLSLLNQGSNTGLVITGMGGMGKTRLMLELGQLAKKKGWLALRALSQVTSEAVEQLAILNTGDTLVLLLVDYAEVQRDFPVLVERLNDLNDTYQLRFRYVATCRTSYYPAISSIPRHRQVCLPPDATGPVRSWFEGYCQQRLCHILNQSGLLPTSERLAICRNIPILAVFLSYLHNLGRDPNLIELFGERDFGTWVAKRVQLSFPQEALGRDIALLVALFPMSTTAIGNITQANYGEIFDRLAADGWIEKLPANESYGIDTWSTIHDVIADQIISSYLSSIPKTVDRFVSELLSLAIDIGCLRSALYSLQRLQSELTSLNWLTIFTQAMTINPISWRGVRDILLQTPLLTPSQVVDLFTAHVEVWDGAEREADVQGALGLLARRVLTNPELALDYPRLSTIISWMQEAVRHARDNTFILRWGIQLDLEAFREATLRQIMIQPTRFKNRYLLRAWLRAGGEKELVQEHLVAWLKEHATAPEASFVYRAWLDAGGEKELVQEHLEAWLKEHATALEADFVYKAWLDAGGEKELVQEHLEAWLKEHATALDTQFVYKAWLDAKGGIEPVREHLEAWLKEHVTALEADFVYKAWLDAGGEKELVQEHLEAWLKEYATALEADFVYKAWLDAGGEKELVQEHLVAWLKEHATALEAQFVYQAWLDAKGGIEPVREHLVAWLKEHATAPEARFVYQAWLDAGGEKELVQEHLEAWLKEHATAPEAQFVYKAWLDAKGGIEPVREHLVAWLKEHATALEADFVYKAWLDAKGKKELVQEHLEAWLKEHATAPEAGFVYQAWLDAGGEKELVQEHLEAWLKEHATAPEAGFVYRAWLDAKGGIEPVREHLVAWLKEHATALEAQFVYKAWLDAKGGIEPVREHLVAWLKEHATALEADFVYKAWLDAGGEKELVQEHLEAWLKEHATGHEVDFVYKAWLDADGEFAIIRRGAIEWLHENREREEAVYLTKFIAKEKDIPIETVRDILVWCCSFPESEDALWRLTQLGRNLLRDEIGEDIVRTSEVVLQARISVSYPLTPVARGQVNTLFSYLIDADQSAEGNLRVRIDTLFLQWLRNPRSFGRDPVPQINIQRASYFKRVADLIVSGTLDIFVDREPLERFLNWVALWQPQYKSQLKEMLYFLKNSYPAPGLWEILD